MGIIAYRQLSEAEGNLKEMEAAIVSGRALKTKAVIVDVWDVKTSGGGRHKTESYVKLKGDGYELVRRLMSVPKSQVKVGSHMTVHAYEGRHYVQGMSSSDGLSHGRWIFLLVFCSPAMAFVGYTLKSSLRKLRH
ncbi:hypothetical protein [Prosthecobacter sp.]